MEVLTFELLLEALQAYSDMNKVDNSEVLTQISSQIVELNRDFLYSFQQLLDIFSIFLGVFIAFVFVFIVVVTLNFRKK